MKQLTCEMCGSNNLVKQDGVFVCQTCGTKYSIEEAKKMMIEGTVRVDNTHLIQNYLEMAERAYKSGNNEEVESYCNKIIEIEPNEYRALMLKGKAAGWQTTLQNNRFSEAINCFSSAVSNAPEEEKGELIKDAKNQVENLSVAIMRLRGDRFEKWPDEDESTGLIGAVTEIIKALFLFATSVGLGVIDKDELMVPVATQINNSVINAWNNKIVPDYRNDSNGHPDDYAWRELLKRAQYCTTLLEFAIKLSNNDDASDVDRYKNLIAIHKYVMNSCSYEYRTVEVRGNFWNDYQSTYENRYCRNLVLNDSAKTIRMNLIAQYESRIQEIEAEHERIVKEEAKKRLDAYWAEHADERTSLETEKKNLTDQIASLNAKLSSQIANLNRELLEIPGKTEIANLNSQIAQLEAEKSALGLFKGKEKNALQEQIYQVARNKKTVQDRMDSEKKAIEAQISAAKAEMQKKISPLQDRVNSIDSELTKDR